MEFNYLNASQMDNLHDERLTNLMFDRKKRELCLLMSKFENHEKYQIRCLNVVGFEMTTCDFWGYDLRILGLLCLSQEEQEILPRLYKLSQTRMYYPDDHSNLDTCAKFLDILIEFISGDIMRIACESIIIDDNLTE